MTIFVNARAIIERDSNSGIELLLQIRSKPDEPERWELPGGQIEPFESVFAALKREVSEETGLDLTFVHGTDDRVLHQKDSASVETFQPFFCYQTTDGPVDSLGFYFRCRGEGTLSLSGDRAKQPTWVRLTVIEKNLRDNPDQFDWLTGAAIERYLHQMNRNKG
jgi:8-oxo-dGTP diphosphatase